MIQELQWFCQMRVQRAIILKGVYIVPIIVNAFLPNTFHDFIWMGQANGLHDHIWSKTQVKSLFHLLANSDFTHSFLEEVRVENCRGYESLMWHHAHANDALQISQTNATWDRSWIGGVTVSCKQWYLLQDPVSIVLWPTHDLGHYLLFRMDQPGFIPVYAL